MKEEILKKLRANIEEIDLHDDYCGTNTEDECDCDTVKIIMGEVEIAFNELNTYWVDHLMAHRKHCSPEGNKELTRIKDSIL